MVCGASYSNTKPIMLISIGYSRAFTSFVCWSTQSCHTLQTPDASLQDVKTMPLNIQNSIVWMFGWYTLPRVSKIQDLVSHKLVCLYDICIFRKETEQG